MKHRRVLQEWERFRKMVVRNDPPEELVLAMKMCFFGGVSIYQRILKDLSAGDGETPEDLQMLSDIDAEVTEFAAEMQALSAARKRAV